MKRIESNLYLLYIFRNFLRTQGKKYTKQERQKYNEKLKVDKKRQEKKENNKAVGIIFYFLD